MDLGAAGLSEQPFPTHGKPLSTLSYASQQQALKILEETCTTPNGLSLLQGPILSGKSSVIRQFVKSLPEDSSYAVVDGNGLNTTGLLEAILRQFGYVFDHNSPNELLALLRVFAMQQNVHALNPSALRTLCELATLKVRNTSALKIVLVSDRPLRSIIDAPAMDCISTRLLHDFHLRPMSSEETVHYVYEKLRAAGSLVPEFVFPLSVCTELWRCSGGWPGIVDRIALLALAKSDTLPVPMEEIEHPALPDGTWDDADKVAAGQQSTIPPGPPTLYVSPPTLYVSHEGDTMRELTFDKPRLLIGRSEHNDIAINSKFISRHHTLLVRHGSSTFLMDLNSSNGTFVNSCRVSNHVLIHEDIITVGHHRIKFDDPHATTRGSLDGSEFADTAILLAQENTEILPAPPENMPTSGI